MLRQSRPSSLALGAAVVTAAAIAAGTVLTAPTPEVAAVVVRDVTVAPAPGAELQSAEELNDELEDRSAPSVSRSRPAPGSERVEGPEGVEAQAAPASGVRHSPTAPDSIWVVVNKRRPLPADYSPELTTVQGYQVATVAAADLTRMLAAADDTGLGLRLVSAHRSYARQQAVYARAVATRGVAAADAVSARPGHSEHQTGLAVDVTTAHAPACDLDTCFAETTAGRWVATEAWRYGFIVRYTGSNRRVTGFAFEPWHLRYVGPELAEEMVRRGVGSLEEALGVRGGDYR